jgi:hypothetical protein
VNDRPSDGAGRLVAGGAAGPGGPRRLLASVGVALLVSGGAVVAGLSVTVGAAAADGPAATNCPQWTGRQWDYTGCRQLVPPEPPEDAGAPTGQPDDPAPGPRNAIGSAPPWMGAHARRPAPSAAGPGAPARPAPHPAAIPGLGG